MQPNSIVATLRRTTVFGDLGDETLTDLARQCLVRHYRRGQFLWCQGDPGDYLCVIAEGLVKVTATTSRGDEMVLATLRPSEEVGHLALFDQGPRSASVVALVSTTAIVIGRAPVLSLVQGRPETLDALLRSMGRLIRQATDRAIDLAFLDLAGRVAKVLLAYDSRPSAGGTSSQPQLQLGLTQSELAQMVGGSRPAVNRVLQELAGRGQIRLEGRTILILDRAGLARRADR